MLLSFCIATYNRSDIIAELVKTILDIQSPEFEVVVVDDCSTDDTVKVLENIPDNRLRVISNTDNQGSIMNIYHALNAGKGDYLFYLNDRDGVKQYKILTLIKILRELKEKKVAYARCDQELNPKKQYEIFESGEEAIVEFACRITHPTGYIYSRAAWRKISKKKVFFTDEKYGDYPTANICAILAKHYKGARILGDLCNSDFERIDFIKEKSGYYKNRKDKRLWYTPEVGVRELCIAVKLMESLNIETNIMIRTILCRFDEYIRRDLNDWYMIVSQPSNSYHYGFTPPKERFWRPIMNGIYIYRNMNRFLKKHFDSSLYKDKLWEILKKNINDYIQETIYFEL